MLVYSGYGKNKESNTYFCRNFRKKLLKLKKQDYYSVRTTFPTKEHGVNFSDEQLRVRVMVSADGHIRQSKKDYTVVELHFKKPRKIDKSKKLLKEGDTELILTKENGDTIVLNDIIEEYSSDINDKYIRVVAELENYKKRVRAQKEQLQNEVTIKTIEPVLEIHNNLFIAINKTSNDEARNNYRIMYNKITKDLSNIGIEMIQTEVYDSDLHDVISVIPGESKKIHEVISNGYFLNGKPFKFPKIIFILHPRIRTLPAPRPGTDFFGPACAAKTPDATAHRVKIHVFPLLPG